MILKKIEFYETRNKLARAARENFLNISLVFMIFLQKFLTTRNKLARAARKIFEYNYYH